MKNKLNISIIIIILFSLSLSSQNTFAKIYDMYNWGNEISYNISQIEDNYIIMGVGYKVKDSVLYLGYNLFKINKKGDLLWKKLNFTDYISDGPEAIYKKDNDLYYVLRNEKEYYNAFLSILHTNENGDTLDLIRINDIDSVHIGNEGITKIGNYFYLLNAKKSKEEDVVFHSTQKVHLIKVDNKGNIIKKKKFDAPDRLHVPWRLYKTHDDNLIFTRVYTVPGDDMKKVAMLCKYDTLLNEIWSTEIGWSRDELSPPYLAPLPDGGYVTSFTIDTAGGGWSFISKYDDTGNRLWKKNLITFYGKYNGHADAYNTYREIYGFNTAKNGDILVHGWAKALRLNGEYEKVRFAPWIARMDNDGNFLWERYLMKNIDNKIFKSSLVDMMENTDGNLMLVGSFQPYLVDTTQLANRQFSFVVQLDSEGCFTPGCDSLTFLGLEYVTGVKDIEEQSIQKLKLYPNPTSDFITIDIGLFEEKYKWELIDILGYIVKTGESSQNCTVDVSGLNPGMYFIRTKDTENIIRVGRIVVE